VPIGRWVLTEACRQAAEWNRRFGPLEMSVNISAREAATPGIVDEVRSALATAGLSPDRLSLEMTDDVLIEAGDRLADGLRALAGDGVHLVLDDFDAGHTVLRHTEAVPITTVKIGRRSVTELREQGSGSPVHEVTTLAEHLQLTTVAQGVEREDDLDHLRAAHCDRAQGFLLAPPAPAETVTRLLAEGQLVTEAGHPPRE
jgi:diguanylate cyclase